MENTENKCRGCHLNWKGSKGCEAFIDKKKGFVDIEGNCPAKITNLERYKKLQEYLNSIYKFSRNPAGIQH